MDKNYGFSYTEMQLMDYLWKSDKKVPFKELLEYANDVLGKNWKKQTLSTYLKNLQLGGHIGVDTSTKFYYYAIRSKEQHIRMWVQQLVEDTFDNSIFNLVAAFSGGEKLSGKEAEELKKLIDND